MFEWEKGQRVSEGDGEINRGIDVEEYREAGIEDISKERSTDRETEWWRERRG